MPLDTSNQGEYILSQWLRTFRPRFGTETAARHAQGFGQRKIREPLTLDLPLLFPQSPWASAQIPSFLGEGVPPVNPPATSVLQSAITTGGGETTSGLTTTTGDTTSAAGTGTHGTNATTGGGGTTGSAGSGTGETTAPSAGGTSEASASGTAPSEVTTGGGGTPGSGFTTYPDGTIVSIPGTPYHSSVAEATSATPIGPCDVCLEAFTPPGPGIGQGCPPFMGAGSACGQTTFRLCQIGVDCVGGGSGPGGSCVPSLDCQGDNPIEDCGCCGYYHYACCYDDGQSYVFANCCCFDA